MAQVEQLSNFSKRLVFLEDEIDEGDDGDEEDFVFGIAQDDIRPLGLCANNCNEVSFGEGSEKLTNEICVQPVHGFCAQAPVCNPDLVGQVSQGAWPPSSSQPYALARPSESGEGGVTLRREAKECFNYAKALLRSDRELERLARKIRTEIQQFEMMELAAAAEKAAEEGLAKFSGRASTFGDNIVHPHSSKPRRIKRNQTFSEGTRIGKLGPKGRSKIGLLALRDVSEVIPGWKLLHSHMRTHMHRRNVGDNLLRFHETGTEEKLENKIPDVEFAASDLAKQSMSFFENIADMTIMRFTNQGTKSERDEQAMLADDQSQCSGSSGFGPTLSGHLSPMSGHSVKRPLLSIPPGLSHPDKDLESSPLKSRSLQHDGKLTVPGLCPSMPNPSPSTQALDAVCPRSDEASVIRTQSSFSQDSCRSMHTSLKQADNKAPFSSIRRNEVESDGPQLALFDAYDDDDASSCPPSPVQSYHALKNAPWQNRNSTELLTTSPIKEYFSVSCDSDFETPTRLRVIRRHDGVNKNDTNNETFDGNHECSPGAPSHNFEPSSLVETGEPDFSVDDTKRLVPLHKEGAILIGLPSIPNIPSAQCIRSNRSRRDSCLREGFDLRARKMHLEDARDVSWCDRCRSTPNTSVSEHISSLANRAPPESSTGIVTDLVEKFSGGDRHTSKQVDDFRGSEYNLLDHRQGKLQDLVDSNSPDWRNHPSSVETSQPENQSADDIYKLQHGNSRASRDEICLRNEFSRESLRSVDATPRTKHYGSGQCSDQQADGHAIPFRSRQSDRFPVDEITTWSQGPDLSLLAEGCVDLLSVGGYGFRRSVSWPRMSGGFDPNKVTMNGFRGAENGAPSIAVQDAMHSCFDISGRQRTSGNSTICHSFPDENFQVALEEMIAHLSPVPRKEWHDPYFADSENNEFLNNYFYCVKSKQSIKAPANQDYYEGKAAYVQPWHANEANCSDFGVDAMCSGLTFLFSSNPLDPLLPKHKSERERTVSLDAEPNEEVQIVNWFGILRGTSSPFRFNASEISEKESSVDFQERHF